jgi:hypothetical protein
MGFFYLQRCGLNDLDPVRVWVLDECQAFHAAIAQALLEVTTQGFETLARGDDIRHRNADMAEATRVGIAVVVGEVGIVFSAVVVGQFQDARDRLHPLCTRRGVGWDLGFVHQRQEVQAEFGFGEVTLFNQGETQDACVEVQRLGDVLDPQHGVVEHEVRGGGVRLGGDARESVQFVQAHGPSRKKWGKCGRSLGLRLASVLPGHDTQRSAAAPNEKGHAGLATGGAGPQTLWPVPWVFVVMIEFRKPLLTCVCLLLTSPFVVAADPQIHWPSGWQVEEVAPDDAPPKPQPVSRQRAIKNDENGATLMVMELTATPIDAGHNVNLQGVLLEMRKSIQKDFAQGGYQSVCSKMHPSTLSRLEALETTCVITENGRHVLSQTLVGAVDTHKAYVFSYAGQADAYEASKDEVRSVRESLTL